MGQSIWGRIQPQCPAGCHPCFGDTKPQHIQQRLNPFPLLRAEPALPILQDIRDFELWVHSCFAVWGWINRNEPSAAAGRAEPNLPSPTWAYQGSSLHSHSCPCATKSFQGQLAGAFNSKITDKTEQTETLSASFHSPSGCSENKREFWGGGV